MALPKPTLGEQLGLGAKFAPTLSSWKFGKINNPEHPDAPELYVAIFDTTCGRVALTFDATSLKLFAAQASELVTGLAVARDLPNNGHRPFRGLDGIG